jgi:hypothetical protein
MMPRASDSAIDTKTLFERRPQVRARRANGVILALDLCKQDSLAMQRAGNHVPFRNGCRINSGTEIWFYWIRLTHGLRGVGRVRLTTIELAPSVVTTPNG